MIDATREAAFERLRRYKSDPRFAIENLLKVRDLAARKMVPLRFNEAQVELQSEIDWFRARRRPVRLWICKARRAGMSTGCEANIFHDTMFTPGTQSLILANENKPARNILQMCHDFWKELPPEFRLALPPEFRNRPPTESLIFPEIDSKIVIATAMSLDQYLGWGFQNIHATEVARWKNADELMTSLYPTLIKDAHSMFFGESTARGQGNFFHEQCMMAAESGGRHGGEFGGFRLLFVPWWKLKKSYSQPFVDHHGEPDDFGRRNFALTLDDQEKNLQARLGVSLEQLHWRRGMLAGPPFNNDPELFDQEFPSDLETAFLSTGFTVFSRTALARLVANKRPPKFRGDVYLGDSSKANRNESWYDLVRRPTLLTPGDARASWGGGVQRFECNTNEHDYMPLHVWDDPAPGDRMVLACDVGGGLLSTKGGDYSTIVGMVANSEGPNKVILTWRGLIRPVQFALLASALAWWCRLKVGDESPPLLAAEWNGQGVPMNSTIDDFHLYAPQFQYFMPGVKGTPPSHHVGWESNGKTKPLAVGYLKDMLETGDLDVPDERCIRELTCYKQYAGVSGEDTEGEGSHDDFVAALYIGAACIRGNRIAASPQAVTVMAAGDDGETFDRFRDGPRKAIAGQYVDDEGDEGDDLSGEMDWW